MISGGRDRVPEVRPVAGEVGNRRDAEVALRGRGRGEGGEGAAGQREAQDHHARKDGRQRAGGDIWRLNLGLEYGQRDDAQQVRDQCRTDVD